MQFIAPLCLRLSTVPPCRSKEWALNTTEQRATHKGTWLDSNRQQSQRCWTTQMGIHMFTSGRRHSAFTRKQSINSSKRSKGLVQNNDFWYIHNWNLSQFEIAVCNISYCLTSHTDLNRGKRHKGKRLFYQQLLTHKFNPSYILNILLFTRTKM